MTHRLDPLLNPRSIAVIGASDKSSRLGGMPLDLLAHFRVGGNVYPVNPKYQEAFGYRCLSAHFDLHQLSHTTDEFAEVRRMGVATVIANVAKI